MKNNISVIIIDDHPLVLNGFEFILKNRQDITLEHTFTTATEALLYLEKHQIDVVLTDINMPGLNGIDTTLKIKQIQPDASVIAISNINAGSIAQRMLDTGASGYLLKNISSTELIEAIHAVVRGEQVLSLEVKESLYTGQNYVPKITQREHEVLRFMAEGQTTSQIAEEMYISPLTVESHRRNLLQKFQVNNSASLIHRATEMKFI